MSLEIIIQNHSQETNIPLQEQIENWVFSAIEKLENPAIEGKEMTIRIVDEMEGKELNKQWRDKTNATNVLSFPYQDDTTKLETPLLGDIVICAPIVQREAKMQNKTEESHWAHLTVHGTLHLLGFDHIDPEEAREMEGLECSILTNLGYPDPYQEER